MNQMNYLGLVRLAQALAAQDEAAATITSGGHGRVIGFECERVVTLGLRGRVDRDVPGGEAALASRGLALVRVDRGDQATLHNPGQLVIFPVWPLGPRGSRAWVELLITCTARLAARHGQTLHWRADAPGLYDDGGRKVAALGVRVRRGISTHGIAINVRNDLSDFGWIRPCGRAGQPLAHLNTTATLAELFAEWARIFRAAVD